MVNWASGSPEDHGPQGISPICLLSNPVLTVESVTLFLLDPYFWFVDKYSWQVYSPATLVGAPVQLLLKANI